MICHDVHNMFIIITFVPHSPRPPHSLPSTHIRYVFDPQQNFGRVIDRLDRPQQSASRLCGDRLGHPEPGVSSSWVGGDRDTALLRVLQNKRVLRIYVHRYLKWPTYLRYLLDPKFQLPTYGTCLIPNFTSYLRYLFDPKFQLTRSPRRNPT